MLEGDFRFVIDGEIKELSAGDAAFIPKGAVHSFDNAGTIDAVMLSVATPGLFGPAYFQELAELLSSNPDGPPDRDAFMGVMARHGLTPVLPAAPAQ